METMDCTAAGAAVMEQCSTTGADKHGKRAQSVSAAENDPYEASGAVPGVG